MYVVHSEFVRVYTNLNLLLCIGLMLSVVLLNHVFYITLTTQPCESTQCDQQINGFRHCDVTSNYSDVIKPVRIGFTIATKFLSRLSSKNTSPRPRTETANKTNELYNHDIKITSTEHTVNIKNIVNIVNIANIVNIINIVNIVSIRDDYESFPSNFTIKLMKCISY
jgi:hypothetical protein